MGSGRQHHFAARIELLTMHTKGANEASMDLFVVPMISFRLLYGFRSDGIVLTMLLCSANGISAHLLKSYQEYYNEARTHLSLHKDATISRAVQTVDRTLAIAFSSYSSGSCRSAVALLRLYAPFRSS
jgi:hypothetical protein